MAGSTSSRRRSQVRASTHAARTPTTSTSSSSGARVVSSCRPTSIVACFAATSRTSTRAAFARPSIARKAAAIRSYLRYLRRHGVIEHDPGASLRAPKGASRLPRVPRVDDANALLDAAAEPKTASTEIDPVDRAVMLRDLALLEVLYGAGLRIAECCGLRFAATAICGRGSSPCSARDRRSAGCRSVSPRSTRSLRGSTTVGMRL